MTAPDSPLDPVCAPDQLADAQAVVARLLPLTTASDRDAFDLQEHLATAWFRQIDALWQLDRNDDIAAVADALCAHFEPHAHHPTDPVYAASFVWPWIARAMCEKARALGQLGRHDAALLLLQGVQQRFGTAQEPALREGVARAGFEEARLRADVGAVFAQVDMVRHCQSLIERFGRDELPATRLVVARTRDWQARLLARLGHDDDALAAYAALSEDLRASADPALQEQAADAQLARARLLDARGRTDEARTALLQLVDTFGGIAHVGVQQTLVLARMDQVNALQRDRLAHVGADADADARVIDACDALLRAHEDSADTLVLRCVNQALRMKAGVLRERGDDPFAQAQADALNEAQWTRHAGHSDVHIQREVLLGMLDQLEAMDDPAQVLAGCQRLLGRFGDLQADRLQPPLARTRRLEAWALQALQRPADALDVLAALHARHGASADPAVLPHVVLGRVAHARLLRATADAGGALAALDLLDALPDIGDEAGTPLRLAVARAMALRAGLWQDLTPPAHARPDGRDEAGLPILPAVTPEELRQAEAVDALVRRFGSDAAPDIREIAADALYTLAVDWREHLHFQRAVDTYADYLRRFAADTHPAIEAVTASAYLNQAYLLMMLMDREADALVAYDALLARFASATSPDMRDTLAKAGASRLTCLNRLQRQGVPVSYGASFEDLSLAQRDAIAATIERGRVLSVAGEHREAIALYDEVLAAHVESPHPELRRQCLDAMVRKAYSLGRLAQREAALAVNDEVIARYGHELSTSAEKDVALAMSNRAVQLDALGRHDEELQTYDDIIARWSSSSVPYLRQRVASARYAKALTLSDTDLEAALAIYQQVIDTCLHAPEAALRLEAAKACVNRGFRLREAGRYDEALACGEALLRACGAETDAQIAAPCVKVRIGLVRTYAKLGHDAPRIQMLASLLALPAAALKESQRAELEAEYRQLVPASTALGKAAHALGRWWGRRSPTR